jgi:hypothetical protein
MHGLYCFTLLQAHEKHEDIVHHVVNLMSKATDLKKLLDLVHYLGDDTLREGAYKTWRKVIFLKIALAPKFLQRAKEALQSGDLKGAEHKMALGFMLLHSVEDDTLRGDKDAGEIADFLDSDPQGGHGAQSLATIFVKVRSGEIEAQGATEDRSVQSHQAARAVMRPPGVRNHDNDCADFRSIKIVR